MAKLLTLKWPKNGQVIDPTAYIYIYLSLSLSLVALSLSISLSLFLSFSLCLSLSLSFYLSLSLCVSTTGAIIWSNFGQNGGQYLTRTPKYAPPPPWKMPSGKNAVMGGGIQCFLGIWDRSEWSNLGHLAAIYLVGISAPKKLFSPPPIPRKHSPLPSAPHPLSCKTPPMGFSIKTDPPSLPGASDSTFPSPEQKKLSETSTKFRIVRNEALSREAGGAFLAALAALSTEPAQQKDVFQWLQTWYFRI